MSFGRTALDDPSYTTLSGLVGLPPRDLEVALDPYRGSPASSAR